MVEVLKATPFAGHLYKLRPLWPLKWMELWDQQSVRNLANYSLGVHKVYVENRSGAISYSVWKVAQMFLL